jgi:5-methylcytosine-specific restriction endonuclease McrA
MILHGKVLILNRSYEPISVMEVRQAMKKMSRQNSSLVVVEWKDETINTVKGEYPVPSVMCLNTFEDIRKKRNRSNAKRSRIYIRDGFRCQYCNIKKTGKEAAELTLDHVLPRAQGGLTTPDNLVTACQPCNSYKGNRTPEQAKMTLLASRTKLRVHLDVFTTRQYSDLHPEWKSYLFLEGDGHAGLSHKGE